MKAVAAASERKPVNQLAILRAIEWGFADIEAIVERFGKRVAKVFTLAFAWGMRKKTKAKAFFKFRKGVTPITPDVDHPIHIDELDIDSLTVGREDEVAEEEKPTVLTDKICLIPGDVPVVRVEDAPGNARRIFTGVDICCPVEDVWDLLTNYGGLQDVVPNLVHNEILDVDEQGDARLWQIGRASWQIFGRNLYFQAGTTLDIHLYPEGMPTEKVSGTYMCASEMTSAEVRAMGRGLELKRDIFPRPFSIASEGIPYKDITMQSVEGEKGDFTHYQGVWRMQPLYGCAGEGEDMTRLTFAVECEPHWFLPVAPVEGRIATALVQNMEAIRDHLQAEVQKRKAGVPSDEEEAAEPAVEAATARAALPAEPGSSWRRASRAAGVQAGGLLAGQRGASGLRRQRSPKVPSGVSSRRATPVDLGEVYTAWDTIVERAEGGAAWDASAGMAAEAPTALATMSELVAGLEAETLLAGVVTAGLAAVAGAATRKTVIESEKEALASVMELEMMGDKMLARAWKAICRQHPVAVKEQSFLGEALTKEEIMRRWPRLVLSLGIPEEECMQMIEMDATPILVQEDSVAEVLARLEVIATREKALELVNWNPALLAGGRLDQNRHMQSPMTQAIVDVLYAGRLVKVLNEANRTPADKIAEIEMYSYAMSIVKPFVDMVQRGNLSGNADELCRRPLRLAAQVLPNESIKIFFTRMANAKNPWTWLIDQAMSGIDMGKNLAMRPALAGTILPHADGILPHMPSIYTRLDILRPHIPSIVRILDPYFREVEPHLDRIMERMDRIEPHLPYILLHLDVLAKHCGVLLDHFDELMPYATIRRQEINWNDPAELAEFCSVGGMAEQCEIISAGAWDEREPEEIEKQVDNESYLPRLLPYVDFLIPRLKELAPHLPLVHPHLPFIIPFLDTLLPYIPRFVKFPKASANADVLIGYLGWTLRIPHLHKVLFLPFVPAILAHISAFLPRGPIRPILERRLRRWEEQEAADRRARAAAQAEAASDKLKAIKDIQDIPGGTSLRLAAA